MELDLEVLRGEALDAGDDAAGGERHAAGADGDAVEVVEDADGLEDVVVVREGLAHPHEDDVGEAARGDGGGGDELADDLAGLQVALEAALAGGAEGASEGAAGLRGDADRALVARGDDDAFDAHAVAAAEEELADAVVGALLVGVVGPGGDVVAFGEAVAQGGRDVRHRVPGDDAALLEPFPDLLGAEDRLPEFRAGRLPFGGQEAPGKRLQRLRGGLRCVPAFGFLRGV